jgi:hypothetical protein
MKNLLKKAKITIDNKTNEIKQQVKKSTFLKDYIF